MKQFILLGTLLAWADAYAWDGKIEFGGMASRGNSNLNQIRGAFSLRGSNDDASMELNLDAMRETSGGNDRVTAERANVTADFNSLSAWTPGQYWFLSPIWRYNRLGYLVQTVEVFGGVGWQWSQAPTEAAPDAMLRSWKLSLEAAPGYRSGKLSDDSSWHEPVYLLRMDGMTTVSEKLSLEGEISYEAGARARSTISRLTLSDRLTSTLSLKINWNRFETRPVAEGKQPVDSIVGISLSYNF